MTRTTRLVTLLVAVLLLGAVGAGAVLHAAHRSGMKDEQQADGPTVR